MSLGPKEHGRPAREGRLHGHDARAPFRQAALLTLAFAALYGLYLLLPSGRRLTHLDFLVTGPGSLQFCDAANPRFLPVVQARSPVAMKVEAVTAAAAGRSVGVRFELRTATGKPIGPAELAPTEGRRIQLLAVDESLSELHQEVPKPLRKRGQWSFAFTPGRPGDYRVFADFTPVATGKEMIVWGDVAVGPGERGADGQRSTGILPVPAFAHGRDARAPVNPSNFTVTASANPIYARQAVSFALGLEGGAPLSVLPLDGAWGRLFVVDQDRKGLAYLHPRAPSAGPCPAPTFRLILSDPGRYAAWATVNWNGRRMLVPFHFEVRP